MEHGRIAGANMAGQAQTYRGSLLMNIVEVLGLEIASFGAWDDAGAEVMSALRPERPAYRKLLWHGDRITGAMILGPARDGLGDERRGHSEGAGAVRGVTAGVEGVPAGQPVRRQAGVHRRRRDRPAAAANGSRPSIGSGGVGCGTVGTANTAH